MKKRICFFVHTEYHLLLSIHALLTRFSDSNQFEVEIILKRTSKSTRLKQDLDFSSLPCKYRFLDLNLDNLLNAEEKQKLNGILQLEFTEFNFFQEQDPITLIVINQYKKKGVKINLFQDGLKPYIAHSMSFSPALWSNNIKQNIWIRKNGYIVSSWFSFINSKMYGFLKEIDQLYLTFPKSFINWKNLPICAMNLEYTTEFIEVLKKVFQWEEDLLEKRKKVIFFMNQPMHDDGTFEVSVLEKLQLRYPGSKIYIKNHPLTSKVKLEAYKKLDNIKIINSKIPAELFISQLEESIILSVCSTSMFINNPNCKFYYLFNIKEDNNIVRLKKYKVINPTTHVVTANSVTELNF